MAAHGTNPRTRSLPASHRPVPIRPMPITRVSRCASTVRITSSTWTTGPPSSTPCASGSTSPGPRRAATTASAVPAPSSWTVGVPTAACCSPWRRTEPRSPPSRDSPTTTARCTRSRRPSWSTTPSSAATAPPASSAPRSGCCGKPPPPSLARHRPCGGGVDGPCRAQCRGDQGTAQWQPLPLRGLQRDRRRRLGRLRPIRPGEEHRPEHHTGSRPESRPAPGRDRVKPFGYVRATSLQEAAPPMRAAPAPATSAAAPTSSTS